MSGKNIKETLNDAISLLMVCLFPVATGFIFVRLLHLEGTPHWFYVFQGLLFLGSLVQFIFFLSHFLIHFLKSKQSNQKEQ